MDCRNQQDTAVTQGSETASAADQKPYLSVVIPAYNEEVRLATSLPVVLEYLKQQPYTWEIVVVDDGSADATGAVAQRVGKDFPVRVLRNEPNRGKGYSIRRGLLEAHGEYRLFSDADLSTPIEELGKFWPFVKDGYSVVIGSRALPDSQLKVRQKFYREFMGRVFNMLVRLLLVGGIHDTQCGFKLFTADAAQAIFPKQTLTGFSFDVEVLVLARKLGFRIKEAPVQWFNSPASKVSAWYDSARMFLDLLRLRLKR